MNSNGVNSEGALVPKMAGSEPSLLSRLRHFPNINLSESLPSSRLRESFAIAAEALRKNLIANLTSQVDMDVEFMINLANAAFESLSSLQADFGDLYDAVKVFIWHQCLLSEAKKERERNESTMAALIHTYTWLCHSSKPLSRAKTNLAEASADVAALKFWIEKGLLKGLEKKLEIGNEKVDELEKAYKSAKTKLRDVAKQIEEMKVIERQIDRRCKDARAGIEQAKDKLWIL